MSGENTVHLVDCVISLFSEEPETWKNGEALHQILRPFIFHSLFMTHVALKCWGLAFSETQGDWQNLLSGAVKVTLWKCLHYDPYFLFLFFFLPYTNSSSEGVLGRQP